MKNEVKSGDSFLANVGEVYITTMSFTTLDNLFYIFEKKKIFDTEEQSNYDCQSVENMASKLNSINLFVNIKVVFGILLTVFMCLK